MAGKRAYAILQCVKVTLIFRLVQYRSRGYTQEQFNLKTMNNFQ